MSRLHEALSRMRSEPAPLESISGISYGPLRPFTESADRGEEFSAVEAVMASAPGTSRLVALTERNSLGADKFRALVNRLTHLRKQRQLHSLQVTSSGVGEGKTVVAANLALTFAMYARCRTLLVEGDLRRPAIASSFGLRRLPGLADWCLGHGRNLASYIRRIHGTSLYVLTAGTVCDRPSEILASQRFMQAFLDFSEPFEWVIVDSPPISPVVDVNLWSRLMDGTILVVREGVTSRTGLKKSLLTLDDPKLIGVVLNEASELDGVSYEPRYGSDSSQGKS